MGYADLLSKTDDAIGKIYGYMTRVEQCEALAEKVAPLQVVFLEKNGTSYVTIEKVLDEDQLKMVKDLALTFIHKNMEEAVTALETFNRQVSGEVKQEVKQEVTEITQEVTEDINENIDDVNEIVDEVPEVELDYEVVKKMVKTTDMSYRNIADELGVPYKKLYAFIEKNNLKRVKGKRGTLQ